MSESDKPREQMNVAAIDTEIVQCEARIDELKARLKVLRQERKKLKSGVREDDALGGRLEEGLPQTTNDPKLGGTMGSGSTL
jgi:chromosome segregation ATPase